MPRRSRLYRSRPRTNLDDQLRRTATAVLGLLSLTLPSSSTRASSAMEGIWGRFNCCRCQRSRLTRLPPRRSERLSCRRFTMTSRVDRTCLRVFLQRCWRRDATRAAVQFDDQCARNWGLAFESSGGHGCERNRPIYLLVATIAFCPGSDFTRGTACFQILLWNGMRWLSGPNNPPKCGALCTSDTGGCRQDPKYRPVSDFDYWIPLEFDSAGQVMQFAPFVDEFNLTLPSTLG